MCQLLGVSCNKNIDINFSLKEFRIRGKDNPHGFGFVYYEKDKNPKLIKKALSLYSENTEQDAYQFKSKIIIGHIRLASCGNIEHKNTHPFVRNNWSFAHNGTISKIKTWQINNFVPEGETDSEFAFCYLLDRIHDKTELKSIVAVIRSEALKISKLGNFNFLLSDGKFLFVFGDNSLYLTKRQSPFQAVTLRHADYKVNLAEIKSPGEKAIIIATEPLTKEETWKQIKNLRVFKDGDEVVV
ncbi:MAG: class II glutamine amidotransferase [candidate division WOR-3 bacterium]